MKLRKNDRLELIKSGRKAIMAKITELKHETIDLKLKVSRGEIKNLHEPKDTRRAIAQLYGVMGLVKEKTK